jgi:hypothetical protein
VVGGAGRCSTSNGGDRAFGAGAEVGGKPTATADTGEVGRWGHDDTLSGTLGEHYQTKLP